MTDENIDSTRAAFEAWMKSPPLERRISRFGYVGKWPGQYQDYDVQLAWEAWRQSAITAAAPPTKKNSDNFHQ